MNKFIENKKTIEEELDLIQKDDNDFSKTREYLSPLIEIALNHIETEPEKKEVIKGNIENKIPIAIERFLKNYKDPMQFSTYFTWYISEEIKKSIN